MVYLLLGVEMQQWAGWLVAGVVEVGVQALHGGWRWMEGVVDGLRCMENYCSVDCGLPLGEF